MTDSRLAKYVKKELAKGISTEQIKNALLKAGYKKGDIVETLNKTQSKIATRSPDIKKIFSISIIAAAILILAVVLIMIVPNRQNRLGKQASLAMADEKNFSDCIKKLEDIANVWSDDKFKEIYVNPEDLNKLDDFREMAFGILRTVCEGNISFKIINVTAIARNKFNAKINMYCDGAVDFKKLGKGYENAVRKEAKPDNLIDHADIILIKKGDACLLEKFNY